jgi:hypothetical protein
MSHLVQLRARGRRMPLGMIGNVLTDPADRGRGLGLACVEAAVAELTDCGAALALLWSEKSDFYARAGFGKAGRERLWDLAKARSIAAAHELDVQPIRRMDLGSMEALYAAKPVRVDRPAGSLGLLCAAPATQVAVARRRANGELVGYAVVGRGDDFPGVVHEWAGSPEAVLACVGWLRQTAGAHTLLGSPEDEGFEALLASQGAALLRGVFALGRILDAGRLWRAIAPRGSTFEFDGGADSVTMTSRAGRRVLSGDVALDLFFGAGPEAVPGLPRAERRALAGVLPWPLYVWGFDSI